MTHIDLGRHLLATPGVTLHFDAQVNVASHKGGLNREDSHFVSVSLDDPEAETFTHYLRGPSAVEDDVSYYNACAWAEETTTLGEQQAIVRGRFHLHSSSALHAQGTKSLVVADDGVIELHTEGGAPIRARASDKDGWETPLWWYLRAVGLVEQRQQVLREILAFVNELPENHTARVAVLGTNIKELVNHADN